MFLSILLKASRSSQGPRTPGSAAGSSERQLCDMRTLEQTHLGPSQRRLVPTVAAGRSALLTLTFLIYNTVLASSKDSTNSSYYC